MYTQMLVHEFFKLERPHSSPDDISSCSSPQFSMRDFTRCAGHFKFASRKDDQKKTYGLIVCGF